MIEPFTLSPAPPPPKRQWLVPELIADRASAGQGHENNSDLGKLFGLGRSLVLAIRFGRFTAKPIK